MERTEPKPVFNAEFIERRFAEHRRWQHAALHQLIEEVIEEIQTLPTRKPKSGYLFDELEARAS